MRPPTRIHPSAHSGTGALRPPWRPVAAQAPTGPRPRPASGRGRHTFSLFDQSSRAPAPSVPLTPFDWEPRELPRLAAGTGLAHTKRFDVIEPIGEGGMGFVYRAYDPIMDRHVALKVLKHDVSVWERRRFHKEAVTVAKLSHPNLPRMFDRGSEPAQKLEWMTMEYLPGRDLGEIVDRRRRIAFPLLVGILAQTLDALDYIHARGIVHCDVKPSNIFVTRDPCDRTAVTVKLIDFGICRSTIPPYEVERILVGDPCYMAPEQAILNGPIDGTADLYALGLTFYEALLGRHPLRGSEPLRIIDVLRMHEEHPLPLPSTCVRGLSPGLLRRIDAVVTRACAKDPADRYRTAKDMKAAMLALRDAV